MNRLQLSQRGLSRRLQACAPAPEARAFRYSHRMAMLHAEIHGPEAALVNADVAVTLQGGARVLPLRSDLAVTAVLARTSAMDLPA
jgi:hypothetical protein